MAALNVKPSIDFKVDTATGIAYMSRRALARALGVDEKTIRNYETRISAPLPTTEASPALGSSSVPKEKVRTSNVPNLLSDADVMSITLRLLENGKVKSFGFIGQLLQAGARAYIYTQAGYNPLAKEKPNKLHEPCVPVRWLCQQLGRSRASVDRTLNVSIHRMRSFGLSTEIVFKNAERCVSPALIICSMFTGKDMQRIRAWLLNLAETDALPTADTLMQLTHP